MVVQTITRHATRRPPQTLTTRRFYNFRLAIPEILPPIFGGRGEIKCSLATRDPALARSLAYVLSARYGNILKELRRMTRRGYDPSKFDPNDPSTWPVE